MKRLSDEEIEKTHIRAKELGLSPDFVKQLEEELNQRSISTSQECNMNNSNHSD